MGIAIALLVIFVGFKLMSKNMRALNGLIIGAFIAYLLYMKYGTNGSYSFTEMKSLFTFISAITGALVLGITLGVLRHFSSDDESYKQRKARLFKFLIKWGAIYMCFTLVFRLCLVFIIGIDWDTTWAIARLHGSSAFLVALFIYFAWVRKKNKVTTPH